MAYSIDGTVHYKAIAIEKIACEWLNKQYSEGKNPLFLSDFNGIHFFHQGTTKYHADVIGKIGDKTVVTISVKKKIVDSNNKIHGTFDLINASLMSDAYKDAEIFVDRKYLEEFRKQFRAEHRGKTEIVLPEHRKAVANAIDFSLTSKSPKANELMLYINSIIKKSEFLMIIQVRRETDQPFKVCIIETNSLNFYSKDCNYFLNKGRGSGSRSICLLDSDNQLIKTGFRLRIVLNNGINALFGLSKSNKDSIWTFKIQVDNVAMFLAEATEFPF